MDETNLSISRSRSSQHYKNMLSQMTRSVYPVKYDSTKVKRIRIIQENPTKCTSNISLFLAASDRNRKFQNYWIGPCEIKARFSQYHFKFKRNLHGISIQHRRNIFQNY
jgi:hypothetical protein